MQLSLGLTLALISAITVNWAYARVALSLVDTGQADHPPSWRAVLLWLGSSTAGALALTRLGIGLARGAALGLAAGLLFAAGDISAKLVVYGGVWIAAVSSAPITPTAPHALTHQGG